VKLAEKVRAIAEQALQFGKHWTRTRGDYPSQILDLIIFHKLHSAMAADLALKSYRQLREKFVDWNEVRISSVREIQEELAGAPDSLQLAVFIKDLLEFVHRERQDVSLEFLAEQNLGDIRRYLKQVRGLDSATVGLILRLKKEHPVFPLNHAMESVLERLGLLRREATKDRKEKALNELVDPGQVLTLHHFILNHSHELCPPDVANVDCPRCGMRHLCAFYAQASRKRKKNSARREARLRGDGVTRRVIRSGEARRAVIRRGGTTRAGAPRGRVPRRGAQRGNRQLSPRPSSIQKRLPGKKVPG
jgi:endonuclease-3